MLSALIISLLAAMIPTAVYATLFYWADRYEREPMWLVTLAFWWGAIPAVVVSVWGEMLVGARFVHAPGNVAAALTESSFLVPAVEEFVKALALFAIYRWAYAEFDDSLDGLIYGAMVGFGFAMTENFLYFVSSFDAGSPGQFTFLVFLRSILFGINHALYTGLTGLSFGLARNSPRSYAGWLYPLLGLLAAILVHGLHNFGITLVSASWTNIIFSAALAITGMTLLPVTVWVMWQKQRGILAEELADEVGETLSQSEYDLLLRRWYRPLLRRRDPAARRQVRQLHLYAELALHKRRLRTFGLTREPDLPAQIERIREKLG
ncbi:MAG: PrsW family intramembrane metalloprotease [Caldilineaceae bacterium]